MTRYDAILPAGGHIDPDFAQVVGTSAKPLIRFQEESLLEHVVGALKGTDQVDRIITIGGKEVQNLARTIDIESLEEGRSGPENILKGLKHLLSLPMPPKKVLIVTADLPFITSDHITGFLELCPDDMEVCVPIIRKSDFQSRFPNSTSTYVPLADEEWTLGGAYLIDVIALQKAMPQIERVFNNRKSVLGMAKLLGPAFLWKFLRKTLTVPDIERKIQSMLGVTGTAVMGAAPELAYDIDALDDYEYALRLLK